MRNVSWFALLGPASARARWSDNGSSKSDHSNTRRAPAGGRAAGHRARSCREEVSQMERSAVGAGSLRLRRHPRRRAALPHQA